MQPIERFNLQENADKEKSLLEYISILEKIYIPDFDFADEDPFSYYDFTIIKKETVSPDEWEAIGNQPIQPAISDTLQIFTDRYNNNLITEHFKYDNYIKHEQIQQFIKELDIDIDKFWMLLLFVYDYSYHYYIEGAEWKESPNEQILKFTTFIINNVEDFNENTGTTFAKPITLKLCVEGEQDIIIDNPTAIHYIASATEAEKKDVSNLQMMKRKNKAQASTSTKDSPLIAYFAEMLLNFFNLQPQVVARRRKGAKHSQKEIDLVCQLIAFTKLSTKSCWTQTENDTLKAFLRQYKDFEPDTINSIYPSFRL